MPDAATREATRSAAAGGGVERAPPALDFARARRVMVENQVRTFDVTDPAVLAALAAVPRERYVPSDLAAFAYSDSHLELGGSRRLLAPLVLARMLQSLEVRGGESALSVACGGGYSVALLAQLGADAAGLEASAEAASAHAGAAERVTVGPLDGSGLGDARFDAILVNGACEQEPTSLLDRLSEGGRLACGLGTVGTVVVFVKAGGIARARRVFDAPLPMLPEFRAPERFVF